MRVGFGPNLADSGALISGLAWLFPESAPNIRIWYENITREILGWVAKKPSVGLRILELYYSI
ncbi:hypothetical protein PRIPAC_97766 [Pristionchus pacificus]|uniref:Uncharacterized protein n=1 Tax=Pristionchus pacificus TaxID=54126 RepID=A0A2A6B319_PRIPA|nr:hypothetical protein PRIPAC_97766 [Pristionchus pacificus]|eukprot:PDM60253.1 hypothetical protein PRIPAC_54078 [Pristionchus pacificus]